MGRVTPKPWLEFPHIWKTEAAFLSYVRGGIRRSLWNKSPIKLEFVKVARKRIVNPVAANRKRFPEVWGATCYACGKDFATKDMEVDHLEGGHSLRSLQDVQGFVEGIVCVSREGLGMICKPCHKIKSYAEKQGLSQMEAAAIKDAIAIQKGDDKKWLAERGIIPAGNAKARRVQIIEYLKENA